MSEPTSSVLFIEVANDPPRVKVFDTIGDTEACLSEFEHNSSAHRIHIFECKDAGWGAEIDVQELRRRMYTEINQIAEWDEAKWGSRL